MDKAFENKTLLILGGDIGAGIECTKLFLNLGGQVIAICRNSAEFEKRVYKFNQVDIGSSVKCFDLDISKPKLIKSFLKELHASFPTINIIISCVDEIPKFNDFSLLTQESLLDEVKKKTWPFFEFLIGICENFDSCPSHAITLIQKSHRSNTNNFAKDMIKTLTRYMATNYLYENCRINIVNANKASVDKDEDDASQDFQFNISNEEIAKTALTICSGQLDALSGESILLDKGLSCL